MPVCHHVLKVTCVLLLETELGPVWSCSPLPLKHNYFDQTLREMQQICVIEASAVTELPGFPPWRLGFSGREASNWISTAPLTQRACIYFSCFTFWIFNEVSVSDGLGSAVKSVIKPPRRAHMKRRPPCSDLELRPLAISADASFHLHLSVSLQMRL